MARFTQYPAATSPTDYTDATNFLIEDPNGNIKLASLEGLNNFFCNAQCASLTIASADVLQLNSTPLEIVPAQGAGTTIEIISASVKVDFNSVAYATNTTLELKHSGAALGIKRSNSLGSTITNIMNFDVNVAPTTLNTQMLENAGLNVTVATSDPASGDSDIEIFVYYRVINV